MAGKKERVIQTRIGERTIAEDKVIRFPQGLIGLEKHYEFTLLQMREDSPFLVLQSLKNPRVGLLVADPYSFMDDFEINLGEAEKRILRLKNARQVAVLVTVTIPPGQPEQTSLNLSGPILVNHEARVGLQVPLMDNRYPSRIYLHEQHTDSDDEQA